MRAAFCSVSLVMLSCAAPVRAVRLSPEEIAAHGTREVPQPPERVWAAVPGALRSLGYPIAHEDAASGLVKTGRKHVRSIGQMGVGEVPVSRQYQVTVLARGTGSVVVAVPTVFVGERDVSGEAVWQLDGDDGERALWRALFSELEAFAQVPPSGVTVPPPPEVPR